MEMVQTSIELIRSLLNNPELNSFANTQVLMAVLIALVVYRLVSPIIDYFNPFTFALNVINRLAATLFDCISKILRKKYHVEEGHGHHMTFGRTRDGMSAPAAK